MSKYMNIVEWNKATNEEAVVAVWGDTPDYPEAIRSIVREIRENGSAVRGDSVYSDAGPDEEVI